MINRDLIRIKITQIVYAFYQNGNQQIDTAEKELFFSLSKAYDMYNLMLMLMADITKLATLRVEVEERKRARLNLDEIPNRKFADNLFAAQLANNKMLNEFKETQKKDWEDQDKLIRSLLDKIQETQIYQDYMASEERSYEEDRELWRKLYRTCICNNDELDAVLEEMSLYWNDDKDIVDTFVLKTIKRFEQKNGARQELLPEFRDDYDKEFASRLLRAAILNGENYRRMMGDYSHNWELNRLAFMDVIIMQIAIAEMFAFANIPIGVTINEYVEIAKQYSTPKSGAYVNALLDHIAKGLIAEKRLLK